MTETETGQDMARTRRAICQCRHANLDAVMSRGTRLFRSLVLFFLVGEIVCGTRGSIGSTVDKCVRLPRSLATDCGQGELVITGYVHPWVKEKKGLVAQSLSCSVGGSGG